MTNKHGLKLKHKNMVDRLKRLYEEKDVLDSKLSKLNSWISQLEKAKNHCKKQIRETK